MAEDQQISAISSAIKPLNNPTIDQNRINIKIVISTIGINN